MNPQTKDLLYGMSLFNSMYLNVAKVLLFAR